MSRRRNCRPAPGATSSQTGQQRPPLLRTSAGSEGQCRLRGAVQAPLQSRIKQTCCSHFQSLLHRRNASIIGLVCRLLAGEGQGNLQNYCPLFCDVDNTHRQSTRLHPAAHLRFIDPTDFRTLDRFRRSWQVIAVHLWNNLLPDLLLTGTTCSWHSILKQAQRHVT